MDFVTARDQAETQGEAPGGEHETDRTRDKKFNACDGERLVATDFMTQKRRAVEKKWWIQCHRREKKEKKKVDSNFMTQKRREEK